MTIYSLFNKDDNHDFQRDEVVGGDVKRAIYNLKTSVMSGEKKEKFKIEDSERGNVQFFTTCIESGALDYLKRLHGEFEDTVVEQTNEEILGGDVEGTKLLLKRQRSQVERTVEEGDIIPGDVYNTVKVFMTEPENKSFDANKEEIVKGNLQATLSSLSQAINQAVVVQKEEIIKADLPATLKSLSESQYQVKDTEKPDVIPGDIQGTIDSLEKAVKQKNEFVKEEVIQGNVEVTLKSLKEAQQSVKQIEKEDIIRGDVHGTKQSLLDSSTEKNYVQHQVSIQGDVKSTMKTLLQPSSQTIQRTASIEGNVKDTIKTFQQPSEENHERFHTGDMAGWKTVTVGIDNQQISTINQRSLQTVTNLEHKVSDPVLKADHKSSQNMNALQQKVTSLNKTEQREFYNSQKALASKAWKKSNTGSDVQTEFPEEQSFSVQKFNNRQRESHTDLINQNKIMNQTKEASTANTSRTTTMDKTDSGSFQKSGRGEKQEKNQQSHQSRMASGNTFNIQHAQVLDTINNNIDIAQKEVRSVNMIALQKETQNTNNTNMMTRKAVKEMSENSKTLTTKSEHQLTKNIKTANDRENNLIDFPPPPPPLQPSIEEPPLAPTPPPPPLPPPPQLPTQSSLKAYIDPGYFPSPPPPVVDKMENEVFPLPSETPPQIMQYKEQNNESTITKTGFQSHKQSFTTSKESKTQLNKFSTEKSHKGFSQKYTENEKPKKTVKQGPDVLPKSKLPIFHTKSGTMSSTKINENKNIAKQSKVSECEQIVNSSESHSAYSEQSEFHKDIAVNNKVDLKAKQRMFYSPTISPVLKNQTLSSDFKALSQEQAFNKEIKDFSHSTTQDYDQISCDQELERIHEESLKTKKNIIPSSPAQTNVTQISELNSMEASHVNESKTSLSGEIVSMKVENIATKLSEQDLDLLTCDRELEKIHEETLKPKRKLYTPCRISPAIHAETPTPKPKTYVRKFKTPLMIAEEKYRQQREEMEKNRNKTVSQVYISASPGTQRKLVSAEKDSIKLLSADSSQTAITPTKEVIHTQYEMKAKKKIASSETTEEPYNKNKQNKTQLASSSSTISSTVSKETQLIEQQSSQGFKESSTQDHISKNIFHKFEKSKQMEQSEMTRTSSPKANIKLDRENLETAKSEMNAQVTNNTGGMKHIGDKAVMMRQKVHEESHASKRTENQELKIQSVSQSSEQKQNDSTSNVQTATNEKEIKTMQNQIIGLGSMVTKTIESPKLQRKLQIKKDQIKSDVEVKQNISATAGQTVKPKGLYTHPIHQQKAPLPPQPKEPPTASESVAKITATEKVKETHATNETLERNLNVHSKSQNKQELKSLDVIEYLRKCEELQKTVSNAKQLESDPQTLNINTFRTFLSVVPTWLISQEKKKNIADLAASSSKDDITEQVSYIKNHAMDIKSAFEGNIQAAMRSSSLVKQRNELSTQSYASQEQITAVAKKVETTSRQRKISNDLGRLPSDMKQTDIRACSPLLKMRSPSPTYITIESTVRRTDSPQRDRVPSSSPLPKEPVTIPLPLKRSTTPKTSSPSPQKSRSEQLAKLKDTTIKLSQGTTQPREITPIPVVVEKKCEIILSPATLRRQLKIESHTKESLSTIPVPAEVTVSRMEDRREIYEEARLSEKQQTLSEKDQAHIPKWLGPDMDTLDSKLISQTTKPPTDHVFQTKTKNVYMRDGENLHRKTTLVGGSEVHMRASKESANSQFRTPSSKFQTEEKKAVPKESKGAFNELPSQGKARTVPIRQIRDHRDNYSKQIFVNRQDESQEHLFKPMMHPETILHASGVEKMESKVARSRTSQNSEGMKTGFEFKHAPPTYEDVISGHMLDISATESPEEILKNFQKTWEESERVFKSLGYTVSDTSEVISSYHQEEFRTGK